MSDEPEEEKKAPVKKSRLHFPSKNASSRMRITKMQIGTL